MKEETGIMAEEKIDVKKEKIKKSKVAEKNKVKKIEKSEKIKKSRKIEKKQEFDIDSYVKKIKKITKEFPHTVFSLTEKDFNKFTKNQQKNSLNLLAKNLGEKYKIYLEKEKSGQKIMLIFKNPRKITQKMLKEY